MIDILNLAVKGGTVAENFKQYGGTVTLSGLIIVFAMLILFVFVIAAFGAIMSRTAGKPKKAKPAAPKTESKPVPKKSAPAPAATAALAPVNGVDDETVAVISAAVSMMYEGTDKIPVIRSVKPAATGVRSAWKTAGVLNNTRPF